MADGDTINFSFSFLYLERYRPELPTYLIKETTDFNYSSLLPGSMDICTAKFSSLCAGLSMKVSEMKVTVLGDPAVLNYISLGIQLVCQLLGFTIGMASLKSSTKDSRCSK